MSGLIYFVRAGADGPIKIGYTRTSLNARLAFLQVGNAETLTVIQRALCGPGFERVLHERFAHLRIRGEWFRPEPELLEYALSGILADLNIHAGTEDADFAEVAKIAVNRHGRTAVLTTARMTDAELAATQAGRRPAFLQAMSLIDLSRPQRAAS